MDNHLQKLLKQTLTVILFIAIFFILIIGKNFLYPLVLSLLISYLLYPIVSLLENKVKLPRLLAILLTIFTALGFIFFIEEMLRNQINVFIGDYDLLKEKANANFGAVHTFIAEKFDLSIQDQNTWLDTQIDNFLSSWNTVAGKILKALTGAIGRIAFIPVFVTFMLLYRDRAKEFILKLSYKNKNFSEKLLDKISRVTIKYMTGVLTVVAILAVCHSTVLSIIGVKYAVFLGLLAASVSIIPYFGTLASTLIPLTFSLILTDDPYQPMWIIIYYLIINSIENNILTPLITGGNVNLNPFITILGLILGAIVWGIPGMIVVIPALGAVKVICDNVDTLKPYGYILGVDKKPVKFKKVRKILKKRKEKQLKNNNNL